MSRQARQKGQVTPLDLAAVAIVFFVGVGLFMLADFLATKNIIVSKQTIYLSMEMDDRGSELSSLLGTTPNGIYAMEIAGDTMASNHMEHIRGDLEGLETKVKDIGSGFSLVLPGAQKDTESYEARYPAQVPVPGAREGNLRENIEMVME